MERMVCKLRPVCSSRGKIRNFENDCIDAFVHTYSPLGENCSVIVG